VIVNDQDMTNELLDQIQGLIFDKNALSRMRKAMASLSTPDAARKIAAALYEITGETNQGAPA